MIIFLIVIRVVSYYNNQTNIVLVKKFSQWEYAPSSIRQRMPYIPINSTKALLTTAENPEIDYFGTIIANDRQYSPAPWIRNVAENPLTIWYWIREAQGRRVFSRSFRRLKLIRIVRN